MALDISNGTKRSCLGEKTEYKKSCETVPLSIASTDTTYIPYFVLLDSPFKYSICLLEKKGEYSANLKHTKLPPMYTSPD